ncbi:MAG: lysylphosphatidylglycerol synthase domain-containing protein [Deltaproteobacteria bacterium]|nr:lysylphosphatidylglycerol synthase domain-containing protein [Deltaproteobacteria bacterium]
MNDSINNEATAPPREQSIWARLIPVALTIVIFGIIFWRIPFEAFWEAVSGARLLPFFAVMGSFSLCFFVADSAVLTLLIRWFHGPIRYRELLPVRASTYIVSIINTQLAQAALALYLNRRFRTPLGEITSTVVLLILLEATNLFFFATVGSAAFPGGTPAIFFVLPVLLALVWIAVVRIARGSLGALGRRAGGNVLLSTFRKVRLPQSLGVLCIKGSVFFLSLLVHAKALTFFGIEIPVLPLLAFLPIVYLVAALPVTVAHLGTSQAAWIFFFGGYAAEADLLAYSLAAHLTFMLANGSFGLIFLPRVYADLFSRRGRGEAAV